jgi:cell division protein ZapA (FtsZ GTPase activity inhibitor)
MRKAIEVEILGQVFSVTSDDGEDHVRRAAVEVERRMRELGGRGQPAFTTAIVAAMNIASDYQKLQDKHRSVEENISRLAARVATCLPSAATGGEEKSNSERAEHSTSPTGTGENRS